MYVLTQEVITVSQSFSYNAVLSNNYGNGDLWVVNFPTLQGCWVEGGSREEVLRKAPDVLSAFLEGFLACGLPFPDDSNISDKVLWDGDEIVRISCLVEC